MAKSEGFPKLNRIGFESVVKKISLRRGIYDVEVIKCFFSVSNSIPVKEIGLSCFSEGYYHANDDKCREQKQGSGFEAGFLFCI